MTAAPSIAETADLYTHWIRTGSLSPNSKRIYTDRAARFLTWLEEQGEEYADALRDPHVRDYACRDYRRKLLTVDKLAPATVAQHMSVLSSLYEWLELGKPQGVRVDVPPSERRGLTEKDLKKVLRAAERAGARDHALVTLIYLAGPRVEEVHSLDVDDIELRDRGGRMVIRYGKGGKPREVPLSSQVRTLLREWLVERSGMPGADTPPLFLSRTGNRLSVRSMQDRLHTIGQSVGVKVSPHTLRHTFGRRSVENGTDLESLRRMLGHASVVETSGYTKPRWEGLEEAVERNEVAL